MGRPLIISLLLLLLCSCYDSFDSELEVDNSALIEPNATIAHLHSLYDLGMREVNQPIVVQGKVTANDEHGNLFKSFIIEQDGYALEILDGLYDSYVRHPLGSSVVIELEGLGLDRYKGVLRSGIIAPSNSSYSLDYMTTEALISYYLTIVDMGEPLEPQSLSFDQLEEWRAGQLIRLEGLTHHSEEQAYSQWSGYTLFRTAQLDSIWCYTSSYADFAANYIPTESLSLSGVLQFGSTDTLTDQYIIKMRGEEDSAL